MKRRGKKKRNGFSRFFGLVFRAVVIVFATFLLISYGSIFINPVKTSIPLFFGLYFVPLVILNFILLILGLLRRSGATWITFIALLPSLLFADLFFKWDKTKEIPRNEMLEICTYNVGLFTQKREANHPGKKAPVESRTALLRDVAAFITKQKPDVICLQEFYISDTSSIPDYFGEYPYRQYHLFKTKLGGGFGNVTLSRFPIISGDKILFSEGTNLSLYSDIDVKGNIVRIYNVHFESHSISFTGLIKRLVKSEKLSEDIADVHDRVAGTFRKRAIQVDKISAHTRESIYPSFICGDFNDTPMSYTYHNLMKDKKDSFHESGRGFSSTYSYLWPLLRIDYILYPGNFQSAGHRTVKVKYSDHYPVFTGIIITEQ